MARKSEYLQIRVTPEQKAALKGRAGQGLSAYVQLRGGHGRAGGGAEGVAPPVWPREVEPLERPWFATPLVGLRAHLLRSSPVPFRKRNLFVDSGGGDRI